MIIYNLTGAPAEGLSHVRQNNTAHDKEKSWGSEWSRITNVAKYNSTHPLFSRLKTGERMQYENRASPTLMELSFRYENRVEFWWSSMANIQYLLTLIVMYTWSVHTWESRV